MRDPWVTRTCDGVTGFLPFLTNAAERQQMGFYNRITGLVAGSLALLVLGKCGSGGQVSTA